MLRNVIPVLLMGIFLLPGKPLFAQAPAREIFFDRYGPEQGLHSRQVRNIVQSADGFIWMATNEGLMRYDGKNFVLFYDQSIPGHISHNRYIEEMIMDDQDRIWIGSNNQVVVYDIKRNHWQYLQDTSGSLAVFPLDFGFDPHHRRMWIACDRGLAYADESLTIQWFSFKEEKYERQPYITVTLQNESAIWLGNNVGYFRLNPNTGQIKEYHMPNPDPAKKNADGIFSSYLQGDSILWLGGWGTGLIRHDLNRDKAVPFFYSDPLKELNAVYDIIQGEVEGQAHQLWVGTIKGLMAFDTRTGLFTPYYTEDAFDYKGVNGAVFSFFNDADHALWIGSGDGLFRFDPRKQGIQKLVFPSFDICFPVSHIAFEKAANGSERIWFAMPYCGSHVYNLQTKEIEPMPAILREALKDIGIFDLYIDHSDLLWVATNEKGLLVYDLRLDQFTSYSGKFFLQYGKWVNKIFESASNEIWVGTYDGLFRFDADRQMFIDIDPVRKLISSQSITSTIHGLAEDRQGNIWATTHFDDEKSGSVVFYDADQQTATNYDRYVTPDLSNIHDFRDVACARNGTVYLTTDRGLLAIGEGDMRKLKEFPEFNANLGTSIYSLALDKGNGIWVSMAFGVSRFNPENNTIFTYNRSNSLIGNARSPGIWYNTFSDKIYVAQQGGIDVISTVLGTTRDVRLHCLGVLVNQVMADTADPYLRQLRFDQNDIEFNLALPSYSNAHNNLFRYILEGYEHEWTSSGNGMIKYNNLPPGSYLFRAVGVTSEGRLSSNTFTLPIRIRPPLWRSIWFQLSVFTITLGVIMLFFLYREGQRGRLQRMRDDIARDLHDEMGSNLSTIKLLSEFELMKTETGEQPVIRTILDKTNLIMDSMYEIIWSIHPSKGQSTDIVERIKRYCIETLEPLDINIRFDITEPVTLSTNKINLDMRRHIFLVFKEAVNNIAKYAHASQVVFAVQAEHHQIVMSLQDNGIGFDLESVQSGHGLQNMKSRAVSMHASLEIQSKPGDGTRVKLNLPFT